jgi:hypothetical protein
LSVFIKQNNFFVQNRRVVKIAPLGLTSGAIPTIASYNASVVKIYSIMSTLVRFERQTFYSTFYKRPSLQQRWRCSCCKFIIR